MSEKRRSARSEHGARRTKPRGRRPSERGPTHRYRWSYETTIALLRCSVLWLSCCFGSLAVLLACFRGDATGFRGDPEFGYGARNAVRRFSETHPTNEATPAHRSPREEPERSFSSAGDNDRAPPADGNSGVFGRVMSEFACRVLSRHVASSNVLVVAPGAVAVAREASEPANTTEPHGFDATRRRGHGRGRSVGGGFLRYGVSEGHAVHAIDNFRGEQESRGRRPGPTLDAWWNSFDRDEIPNRAPNGWWSSDPTQTPAWILLAVFDSPFGSEDDVWREAESFLESCTVTYVVAAVHSARRADGSHRYGGTAAVGSLLRKKYKVQALSSSHYHAEETNAKRSFERYGPNALFRSVEELKGFLRWGADAAHRYGDGAGDGFFTSYVFATQGLDLAIPTPQLYLRDGSGNIDVFDKDDMSRLPPLRACPKKANDDELNFVFEEVSGHPGRLLSVVSTP
mmetsp:Transcript_2375/g.5252  ORF Transcript_2375/g.5252 Transcript_2375/m.5252 type:complete len:457 (+) Transcript_2375:92-1462(+)